MTKTTNVVSRAERSTTRALPGMALIAMLAWTMGPTAVSAAPSCLADSNPNLVRNGGFESGSGTHVTDWKVEWSSSADPFVYIERGHAHNGAQDLALGTTKASNDIVQKVRGTSRDNIYTICFWLYSSPNVTGGVTTFDVLWNNVTELNLTNSAQFGYQYFAINVLAQGDDSDYLRFRERNNQGFYYMDDVSVQLCSGCTLAPDADRRAKSTQAERTPLE